MKRRMLVISLFGLSPGLFAQWMDLGVHGTHVQMLDEASGYNFINIPGSTPSSGTKYEFRSTTTDWQDQVLLDQGGGTASGCCVIRDIAFLNFHTGIRCKGFQGIYSFQKTTNGGLNWTNFAGNVNFSPVQLILVNDTSAFISGNDYATNKGQLFRLTPTAAVPLFTQDSLSFTYPALEFPHPNVGFMLLNNFQQQSYVLKTSNAGENWTSVFFDEQVKLTCLSFTDTLSGYAGSETGRVYKTTNGGLTWEEMTSPSLQKINTLDFITGSVGYVACNAGELYKTSDGALSWQKQLTGTLSNLIDIQMPVPSATYCMDDTGKLLKRNEFDSLDPFANNSNELLIVYPNPSAAQLSVDLKNQLEVTQLDIYDLRGKKVLGSKQDKIDVSNLTQGSYLIRVYSGKQYFTAKFMKM